MRNTILLLVFMLFQSNVDCQLYNADQISNLNDLLKNLKEDNKIRHERVGQYLNSIPEFEKIEIQKKNKNGYEIFDIINGQIQYRKSYNTDAGIAMGVPAVRNGGELGLNLTGEGLNIGIWDGGLIRTTHEEFEGRIKYFDAAATTVYSDHATGVAGTLLGSGLNFQARGMAPKATGIAYNFNDDEVEMVEAQILKEIVVSNHSYGLITGWSDGQWYGDTGISDQEDWRFGFYDGQAKTWDDIAVNAPYYLIVKSAGNDRGDSGNGTYPSDGPYDCIASASVSKNIMVVGAVQKSSSGYENPDNILMSSFSGWGPTDDGRIKPDIVGVGVDIRTSASGSDDDYQVTSGTSFSSPAVCGGLALLQELHKEKYNEFMRASSLKALAIHTATQTGKEGPDYRFGWGLLNVRDAASFILEEDGINNRIIEDELTNGQSWNIEINPIAGTEARFTLVWTDPSGNPVPSSLDPEDLMLINDLDLRLTDETGISYMPYILDPSSPQLNATTGDNFRDNVEQVFVNNIEDRKYFLTITNKGNLANGVQNFSLIVEYQSSENQLSSLYWIGGEGDWENNLNWSHSSGGPATNISPSINHRVIIDDNSFPTNRNKIILNGNTNVGSISAFVTKPFTIDLNGNTLTSEGNIKLNTNYANIVNGRINCFSTNGTSSYSINLDSANTDGLVLEIPEGNNSCWAIDNSYVNLDILNFKSGNLNINNSELVMNEFSTGPPDDNVESHLSLENSDLILHGDFNLSGCTTFQETASNIVFNDNADFNMVDYHFSESVNLNSATVNIISSGASIENFSTNGSHFSVSGTLKVRFCELIENSSMQIGQNSEISILESFYLEGSSVSPLTVLTGHEDGSTFLNIDFHEKLCFDNLSIENLTLTGLSSVSIGANSSIVNSPGWSKLPCDKLLFSDFDTKYACVSAQTEFLDRSEGQANSWEWYVDGNLSSNQQNFYTSFQLAGPKEVELRVENEEGNMSRFTKTVDIVESPLDSNTVIISTDDILASQKPAESYQWYKNNEKLDGETSRTYFYNGVIADYYVVTFEGDCNRKSKELRLLTSSHEEELNSKIELFPNPTDREINIFTAEPTKLQDISILSTGGIIINADLEVLNDHYFKLDLNELVHGVYVLTIQTQDAIYSARILKM